MKICWDELEKYQVWYYAKRGTFRVFKGGQWRSFVYHESCLKCGEPFLNPKNQDRFCCGSCANSYTNIKLGHTWDLEKAKASKLKKYGNENYVNSEKISKTKLNHSEEKKQEIQLKKEETWFNNYGVTNPNKCEEVRGKIEETNLKRYGSPCSLGNKDIWQKSVETTKEIYGIDDDSITNVAQIPQVKEKIVETNLKNHGVECVFLLDKYRYSKGSVSPISQKFFWALYEKLTNECKELCFFHELNNEFMTTYCNFDFKVGNCVIEYNGDLWHANPKKYKEDDLVISFLSKKMFAKDIWKREERRNNKIYDDGYKLLIIWDNHTKKYWDETIDNCLEFVLKNYK